MTLKDEKLCRYFVARVNKVESPVCYFMGKAVCDNYDCIAAGERFPSAEIDEGKDVVFCDANALESELNKMKEPDGREKIKS